MTETKTKHTSSPITCLIDNVINEFYERTKQEPSLLVLPTAVCNRLATFLTYYPEFDALCSGLKTGEKHYRGIPLKVRRVDTIQVS